MNQRRPMGSQGDGSQPFDQRFLLFMVLSVCLLLTYNNLFAPPPVEPAPGELAEQAQAGDDAPIAERVEAADEPLVVADPGEAAGGAPVEAEPVAEPARVSLGSVAPDGPYRMLVTLDNVGAAVERVELSSDNYRDLDDRSGYLGNLSPTDAPSGGALVNAVGPGTPAAEAGFEVGDVITDASDDDLPIKLQGVSSADDLRKVLAATKPEREQSFTVMRDGKKLTLTAKLRRQPLSLLRPEVENVRLHTPNPPADAKSVPSFLVRLKRVGDLDAENPKIAAANQRLLREAWTVAEADDEAVVFRKTLADLGLELTKRFELAPTPEPQRENKAHPSYHFRVEVGVRNLADADQRVSYELTGPNGLPIEGHWYATKIGRSFGSYGLRDIVVRYADGQYKQFACSNVVDNDVPPMGQGQPLAFIGVDAQYFASIVIPEKPDLRTLRIREARAELATPSGVKQPSGKSETWENASFVLAREPASLAAGAAVTDGYTVFAGPKLPALLRQYQVNDLPDYALDNVLYYGWFGPVARLMLGILHFFNSLVGNYGVAIILLTVVVRGVMFPLSRHQVQSMAKMQALKPEMDRINEKYKEDMQKRSQATNELFRKHNVNPAAGCLPMFLQLPIFLGLYRALAVDVELRQAPLLSDAIRFCSNLAAPDMLLDWSGYLPKWFDNGDGILALGPFFNLLPMFSVALFLLQQKMFMPEPTNEQARLQQKLMKYMMVMMGFFLFKIPSGLCLYFVSSTLWAVGERKLLPRPIAPGGESTAEAKPSRPDPKPSNNGEAARRKAKRKRAGGKKRR